MTISTIDERQRTAARAAGVAYLVSFASAVFAYYGAYRRLIVVGNVAETARNIIEHERLFRIAIACDLIYVAGVAIPSGAPASSSAGG